MPEHNNPNSDEEAFLKILNTRMPFGKYKGCRLIDLPEDYVMWFARNGFPKGKLGDMLKCIYEIQLNGLVHSLNLRNLRSCRAEEIQNPKREIRSKL